MSKLSSKEILKQILQDVNFKQIVEKMTSQVIQRDIARETGNYPEEIDTQSEEYKKLSDFLQNPKSWKRWSKKRFDNYSKYKVTKNWKGVEYTIPDEFGIGIVDGGTINEDLLNKSLKLWVDSKYSKKMLPFERIFSPDHEDFQDNYRIEVFTTGDDSEIICWTIVED